jgi:hypothetical protein
MKTHIIYKCAQILVKDWAGDKSRPTFHYTFAVRKNKILTIGKAQPDNPSIIVSRLAKIYKIEKWIQYPYFHSESNLIAKIDPKYLNKQLEILNLRINRHGKFRFCKPCINCQKLLDHYNIHKVSWSTNLPEDDHKIIMLDGYEKLNIENPCFLTSFPD